MSEDKKDTFRVQAFSKTDKARRPNNEDFVALWEPEDFSEREKNGCIYIVADGVGGASVGERASKYAAEKVLFEFSRSSDTPPGERLKRAMKQANREIHDYAEDNGIRMATTMVVAVIRGNQLYVANVGDSRAYLIHGLEVTQITHDHSLVGERVRDGSMTEAEAQASKIKNRLTRSIGGDPDVTVDVFDPITLRPGDKLLLCTDGLTRYALKNDIVEMIARGSAEEIADRLVAFAKKHGGADNVSVVVAHYEPSAVFEPTLHTVRPVEVTPADLTTTEPAMPKVYPAKKQSRLSAGAYISIGIVVTLIFVAVAVIGVGMAGGLFVNSTTTPTLTPPPTQNIPSSTPGQLLPTETFTPLPPVLPPLGPLPSDTPQAGDLNQLPSLTPTQTMRPIMGIVKNIDACRPFVFVRSAPRIEGGTSICVADASICYVVPGRRVQILGVINVLDDPENPKWYLIPFLHPTDGMGNYWITASCVDLEIPADEFLIPILNDLGTPVSSSAPQ